MSSQAYQCCRVDESHPLGYGLDDTEIWNLIAVRSTIWCLPHLSTCTYVRIHTHTLNYIRTCSYMCLLTYHKVSSLFAKYHWGLTATPCLQDASAVSDMASGFWGSLPQVHSGTAFPLPSRSTIRCLPHLSTCTYVRIHTLTLNYIRTCSYMCFLTYHKCK